jgi:hypothetical protein
MKDVLRGRSQCYNYCVSYVMLLVIGWAGEPGIRTRKDYENDP